MDFNEKTEQTTCTGTRHGQINPLISPVYVHPSPFIPLSVLLHLFFLQPPWSLAFATFGSLPKQPKLYSPEMLFPAQHDVSHPCKQWLPPPVSISCFPIDLQCWVFPWPMGLRLPHLPLSPPCSFMWVEMGLLSCNLTMHTCKTEG